MLMIRKNDLLLIAVLIVLTGGLWIWNLPGRAAAMNAEVYHGNARVFTVDLSGETTWTWREGEAFVTIEVTEGGLRVADASCPDHLCSRQGRIAKTGQSIVCLPNKVSVVLVGGAESEVDATL